MTATIATEIHTLAETQLGRAITATPNAYNGLDLDGGRVRLAYDDGDLTVYVFDGHLCGHQATFRDMPAAVIAPVAATYLA